MPSSSSAALHFSLQPSQPEIAIVIPTFNEKENVQEVIRRLDRVLSRHAWEVIFVDDDSPDGTSDAVRCIASFDPRVRVIQRIGRRGLSSACIEGMLSTSAEYIAVMDADLQHDEKILPAMLEKLEFEELDIVVGTRNSCGGSMGDFAAERVLLSRVGSWASRTISHCRVTDPMSGFFLLRRSFLLEVVRNLDGRGFKILLDLLASSARSVRLGEVGYRFRPRRNGESKLDLRTGFDFLVMLISKMSAGFIGTRFASFGLVGTIGLCLHFAVLVLLYRVFGLGFELAQSWATMAAMIGNFFLNDLFTYRDRRLKGAYKLFGLLAFCTGCSFGAIVNVSFAEMLHRAGSPWFVAGLAGNIVSAGWNYSVSTLFTWRSPALNRREQPRPLGAALSLK